MKVVDLFSGIGGFSLAAHWMGWQTIAFCEQDKFCQKVLRKNFDNSIPIYDDVRTFPGESFRGADILTGGFPCQPFSAAGKRKGRDDERHLFPAMLRVISEVRPRWVVAENVRGLLSIESGKVFSEVVSSLEGEGYEVITFCVPASAVEAPHRRDRLWFIGHATHDAEDIQLSTHSLDGEHRAERGSIREAKSLQGVDWPSVRPRWVSGTNFNVTNAAAERLQGGDNRLRFHEAPGGNGMGELTGGTSGSGAGISADAQCSRFQGDESEPGTAGHDRLPGRAWGDEGRGWDENWLEAATRLCRVDDGVSDRVHRLKALGNSIVPQIAYEIFRAIEQA